VAVNDRLEIGILRFISLVDKDGFLRRGFTWAVWNEKGNTPELTGTFIILVIGRICVWRQEFSRNVRIGSSSQDLVRDDKISLIRMV